MVESARAISIGCVGLDLARFLRYSLRKVAVVTRAAQRLP
jgi:hypothetical protein